MKKRKSIGPIATPGQRLSAGIGYVVIPSDVDRSLYIKQCYRTGTVLMYTEDHEVMRDVSISLDSLRDIVFPTTVNELGSAVAWLLLPLKKQPVITAVILKTDETFDLQEHQYKVTKTTDTGLAEISLRGDKGLMSFNLEATENDGGQLNISVKNKNSSAQMNVLVKGSANIQTDNNIALKVGNEFAVTINNPFIDNKATIIKYTKSEGFSYIDEFDNSLMIKNGQVTLKSKKIVFGDGSEPMILGNVLKDLLDELITEISNITTATMLGAQPIINKAQVLLLKKKVPQILSKLGFLN